MTSSTDEEIAAGVTVVAQVHHDPIPEQEEVALPLQEEVPHPPSSPSPTTVNEPPKGLYKITCRHKIL